jgi:hypothetical protein
MRRSQSGQALIIMTLGFVGLLGFLGLVTDVSLLLVRQNQLIRAVDSAAINAANQMRSDRSFGQVGLAARMMIEMHGFESEEILVQTCESLGGAGNTTDALCNEANRYRKLVRVGARVDSPTVFLRVLGIPDIEISAVSTSETAVLDVVMVMDVSESMLLDTTYADWASIGYGRVYVPPVLEDQDGNESANIGIFEKETLRASFETRVSNGMFPNAHNDTAGLLDDRLQFWGADVLGGVYNYNMVYPDQVNDRLYYPDDGGTSSTPETDQSNLQYRVRSFNYPGTTNQAAPREACRVRFWPYSVRRLVEPHIRSISGYSALWEGRSLANTEAKWGGFIPTYDFYGCCNDPTAGGRFNYQDGGPLSGSWVNSANNAGDNDFSDLICQPFKAARDATRAFLQTLDFERGDRVALVTFDRGAFLVDPDGSQGTTDLAALGSCPRDPDPVSGRSNMNHMMASFCRASATLMEHVGVRAEPNFYDWNDAGGGWLAFADGLTLQGDSKRVDYYRQGAPLYEPGQRAITQYPVNNNCPMFDATMDGYQSRYSMWNWDVQTPNYFANAGPGLLRIMTPRPGAAGWPANLRVDSSYDLRASCRSSNVGAGLREANNALLDPTTTRRTGAVWVIIMMSDGSAGASDPVRANGRKLFEANPFRDYGTNSASWQTHPTTGVNNLIRYGISGEYGAFGLCPIGVPGAIGELAGELMDVAENPPAFPYCSDEAPHTRHFCVPPFNDPKAVGIQCVGQGISQRLAGFAPGAKDNDYACYASAVPSDANGDDEIVYNLRRGNIYDVDIGAVNNGLMVGGANCDLLYDVDDYARDWADYVGLSRETGSAEQLPTIFTIGFGIDFPIGRVGTEAGPAFLNVDDFLGEELLRYIADVGDNFQIDTDYQQDLRQDQQLNGNMTGDEVFAERGPCEDQEITHSGGFYGSSAPTLMGNGYSTRDGGDGTMVRPLPPTQDCGNYYNAPDQARLGLVFDDIASRMFTRLAP